MHLLLIRHGDAGDHDDWIKSGRSDAERPLSDKGRRRLRRAAKSLSLLVPEVGLVASSPFTRAVQTAEALYDPSRHSLPYKLTQSLLPDADPEEFVRWLRGQRASAFVAAIGHEPHLSTLATWLIAGVERSCIKLRKGGACLISFAKQPQRSKGTLEWLVGPKQL